MSQCAAKCGFFLSYRLCTCVKSVHTRGERPDEKPSSLKEQHDKLSSDFCSWTFFPLSLCIKSAASLRLRAVYVIYFKICDNTTTITIIRDAFIWHDIKIHATIECQFFLTGELEESSLRSSVGCTMRRLTLCWYSMQLNQHIYNNIWLTLQLHRDILHKNILI